MSKIKRVAVFGIGRSGKAAIRLAKKHGQDLYVVNRGQPDDWYEKEGLAELIDRCSCYAEDDFVEHFSKMEEIILSPGIPLTHPALKKAREKNIPILSEIEYAYRFTKDIPVIAITGTNGKTTTTTMIQEALEMMGKKVFCGGNIGIPYCELALQSVKPDFAVIEVSSFQLETIAEFHPRIGLILNIYPNHSERYDDPRDYALAKYRLLLNMTKDDHLILGQENDYLSLLPKTDVSIETFSKENEVTEFDFSKAKLKGKHNQANFYAASLVLKKLGLFHHEKFQAFIESFKGVAHRLEFVREWRGLDFYNDAKSTNALATTTAIKAFENDPRDLYLILAGKLRNETDTFLPDLLPFKKRIKKIFTIGGIAKRLERELSSDFAVESFETIPQFLEVIKQNSPKGLMIFSPGHPSFDQFTSYVDRGERFKNWVNSL